MLQHPGALKVSDPGSNNPPVDEAPAARPGWGSLYAQADPPAVLARYRADPRRYEWLAFGRGLVERLEGFGDLFDGCRPEVEPVVLPASSFFILGADEADPPGCLGHVAALPGRGAVGKSSIADAVAAPAIEGTETLVSAICRRMLEVVEPLLPQARMPEVEVHSGRSGVGDSHGLSIALAVLHGLLDLDAPRATAATGGFDVRGGRFKPVPTSTLATKAAAARRWGVRRILVVEGQEIPDEVRRRSEAPGIDWIEVPDDPALLPLQLPRLLGADHGGAIDPRTSTALRSALALYDMTVVREQEASIDAVFAATRPFLPSGDPTVESHGFDGDPVLALLAADIRSRSLLHAGRSVEAAEWNQVALGMRGRGDLPEGILGDHLLYEHPSHAAILSLDLGLIDDPTDATVPALDRVILELEGRWCTRHQSLLLLFARNTRWRRRLYRARWRLDAGMARAAREDLLADPERWGELLADHATDRLGMGNSTISRQWNYLIEQRSTEMVLAGEDPGAGFDFGPDVDAALKSELARREARIESLSSFDLRGFVQGRWVLGEFDRPVNERLLERLRGDRRADDVRWAEWFLRCPGGGSEPVRDVLARDLEGRRAEARGGVGSLVALRRAVLLEPSADADPSGVDLVPVPVGPESLVAAFESLAADPTTIVARAPY